MVTVISTGRAAPTKARCLASVAGQQGVDFEHVYIDAAEQANPLGAMANLVNAVADLPADRVVALVDGDDYLARNDALYMVAAAHDLGAWATYGSFKFADGRPSPFSKYETTDYRGTRWQGSHLKTFRAGIFNRIRPSDLALNGRLLDHARDLATMFPILEMAGERVAHIPEILYVYNYATSTEATCGPEVLEAERRSVAYVRGLPRYERVERL